MATEIIEAEIKTNIGDLAKGIEKTGKATKDLAKDTKEVGDETEKVGEAAKKSKKGFGVMGKAIKGVGTAFKAMGIGAVIAIFVALKEAMERNQKVMNLVNTIMTTISTTFNQVISVLTDTVKWVTESSDRFDGMTAVIKGLMTIALTPLKLAFYAIKLGVEGAMLAWENSFLGGGDEGKIAELRISIQATKDDIVAVGVAAIDAGKDIGNNIVDAIGEIAAAGKMAVEGISEISIAANYAQAEATTAAQNSALLAEAQIQGLIEKNDRLSELQRQIRDDERKTFAERIEANEEISRILIKQEKEMLELADTRVAAAKLERDANMDNIDLEVAYQATLNDRAGVQAQIAGFKSEQIVNEAGLEKELSEVRKELAQESIEGIERELLELKNAYELKLEMARKAGVDTTELTRMYEKQKSGIIEAGVTEQMSAYAKLTGALGVLAGENKALAVAAAIMDTYAAVNGALAQGKGTPLAFIQAATVLATGLANVRKIMEVDTGGAGGSAGGGASTSSAIPDSKMMSGSFSLNQGQAVEPLQAYVVSDDITNNQNKLAIIRRRATI